MDPRYKYPEYLREGRQMMNVDSPDPYINKEATSEI